MQRNMQAAPNLAQSAAVDGAATPQASHFIDQIAYCSIATPSVSELGLAGTVAAYNDSAAQHCAAHITGLLMWEDRLMIHWLEGPRDTLDAMWSHIENDPRQHCVVLLLHKRGEQKRLFNHWAMQRISRNEMKAIVRQAKEQASQADDPHTLQWQPAINTLGILLDGELTACYAQGSRPLSSGTSGYINSGASNDGNNDKARSHA